MAIGLGKGRAVESSRLDPVHVYRVAIVLSTAALESLRSSPREYVQAGLKCDDQTFASVAIRLKGSTGSFRGVDDKPGLTVDMARYDSNLSLQGQTKFHLNNSVEDPSYLSEQLGAEFFRAAGVPVPDVSHALVTLNGRELGLYVVVEGLTSGFLRRHFVRTDGEVFEKDLELDKEAGEVPVGLSRLWRACRESGQAGGWQKLGESVNRSRFVSFLTAEAMVVHRDGYGPARNNFRIYVDPETGCAEFIPHGMDQLFQLKTYPVQPQMAGSAARAWVGTTEGVAAYQSRFRELFQQVYRLDVLTNRVTELAQQLQNQLDRKLAAEVQRGAGELTGRIVQRGQWLATELTQPARQSPTFVAGVAKLVGWQPVGVSDGSRAALITVPPKISALEIAVDSAAIVSWQTQLKLPAGRYIFEGRARTVEVEELPFGKGSGAALRWVGGEGSSSRLIGTSEWEKLYFMFEVPDPTQDVLLRCELRAQRGRVYFDFNSLLLRQLK